MVTVAELLPGQVLRECSVARGRVAELGKRAAAALANPARNCAALATLAEDLESPVALLEARTVLAAQAAGGDEQPDAWRRAALECQQGWDAAVPLRRDIRMAHETSCPGPHPAPVRGERVFECLERFTLKDLRFRAIRANLPYDGTKWEVCSRLVMMGVL